MNQLASTRTASPFLRACYQLAWRWHFYAGLFVIPFLIMLSITGTIMLYDKQIQSIRYQLDIPPTSISKAPLAVSKLIASVQDSYPNAHITRYIRPKTSEQAAFVLIKTQQATLHIALDPYTAEILSRFDRNNSFYAWANDIHGSLLIGTTGDRLIEIAAGLMMLLLVSGLYMWLPSNNASKRAVFWPTTSKGRRTFYRELHSSLGFYTAIALLFFIVSGLAWSGVWGSKIVQPWSSFPMQKSQQTPLSTIPHASLNQGVMEEVPWNLEQAPLPESIPQAQTINIDSIVALAKKLDMQQYQIRLPLSERAVYSLTASTMSGDVADPRLDRTVHIDQYSGKVLADIGWDEYSMMAKFMAAGIALHQGDMGVVNLVVNTLLCIIMLVISVSALLLWWLRRPAKSFKLHPPSLVKQDSRWKLGLFTIVLISLLFPLTGVAILAFVVLDLIYIKGLKPLAHQVLNR